jgi:hypothetical protein
MTRRASTWFAIVCLTLAAFTTACDRVDPTGPSETPAPSFDESQGGNN